MKNHCIASFCRWLVLLAILVLVLAARDCRGHCPLTWDKVERAGCDGHLCKYPCDVDGDGTIEQLWGYRLLVCDEPGEEICLGDWRREDLPCWDQCMEWSSSAARRLYLRRMDTRGLEEECLRWKRWCPHWMHPDPTLLREGAEAIWYHVAAVDSDGRESLTCGWGNQETCESGPVTCYQGWPGVAVPCS